jgi:uncharacterized protein DUF4282/zinc ribbon protein
MIAAKASGRRCGRLGREGNPMEAKGFFASLFDYSFSAFITPKIIKLLYILSTIVVVLWTIIAILWGFKASTGFGIVMLVILGPLFFLFAMIYVRVFLELLIVFFRIHGDVNEINRRGAGETGIAVEPLRTPPPPQPALASAGPALVEAPVTPAPEARYCASCGTEQVPGKRFCTHCGAAVE